jgi:hypothetical protein
MPPVVVEDLPLEAGADSVVAEDGEILRLPRLFRAGIEKVRDGFIFVAQDASLNVRWVNSVLQVKPVLCFGELDGSLGRYFTMSPDPPTESKSEALPKFAMLFVVWLLTALLCVVPFWIPPLRDIGPPLIWVFFVAALWTGGFFCAKIIHRRSDLSVWIAGGFLYAVLLLCSYIGLFIGYCAMSDLKFH